MLKEIKNITSESIIDVKFYGGKNKVNIYSSDIIEIFIKQKLNIILLII